MIKKVYKLQRNKLSGTIRTLEGQKARKVGKSFMSLHQEWTESFLNQIYVLKDEITTIFSYAINVCLAQYSSFKYYS